MHVKTLAAALSAAAIMAPASLLAQPTNNFTLVQGKTASMGKLVAAANGQTVYALLTDSQKADEKAAPLAACDKACQSQFTPVKAVGAKPQGWLLAQGLVGAVKRADGTLQATFNGLPLYTFAGDQAAGDVNGQGFNKVAYVVSTVGKLNTAAPKQAQAAVPAAKTVAPVDAALFELGKEKYAATCSGCHGPNGEGAFGAALKGNKMIANDDAFIKQILVGSGDMPSFAPMLADADVAAIATFARNAWGNKLGGITVDQVKKLR
ncbi:c-type cytochrome [Comamonas antarctica]|uniref:c-type cytochrome n=1 Tax=Comamonas antarctica TaxID=2743470 RepID=UPI0028EDA0F1|nr:c-type cytochrome [Comamonas antarctica]